MSSNGKILVDVGKSMGQAASKIRLKRPMSTGITELQSTRDQQNLEGKRHDVSLRPCLSFTDRALIVQDKETKRNARTGRASEYAPQLET